MATQEEIQAVIDDRYQALAEVDRKANLGLLTMHGRHPCPTHTLQQEIEWLNTVEPNGLETVNDLLWRGKPKPAQSPVATAAGGAPQVGLLQRVARWFQPKVHEAECTSPTRAAKQPEFQPYVVGGVISCHKPQRRSGAMRWASRQS